MNENQKKVQSDVSQTLQSWDNPQPVVAPETLKKRIMDAIDAADHKTAKIPVAYYYRTAIAAAVILLINAYSLYNDTTRHDYQGACAEVSASFNGGVQFF